MKIHIEKGMVLSLVECMKMIENKEEARFWGNTSLPNNTEGLKSQFWQHHHKFELKYT